MKKQLVNGDYVELSLDAGKVLAKKMDKKGTNIISTLNVSRDMATCSNPVCLALTNGGFFVFWLNKIQSGFEIYGRRYTAQGLAGKIIKFRILNLSCEKDITVELQDDFFLLIKWQSTDNKIYKKIFNQDGEYKTDEEFVEDVKVQEPEKENITFSINEESDKVIPTLTVKTSDLDLENENMNDDTLIPPPTPSMKHNLQTFKIKPNNNVTKLPPIQPKFFSAVGKRTNNKFKMGFL